jgi:two-component system, cell cycle response regulator
MPLARIPRTGEAIPPENVLRQLRIPFVRRATLVRGDTREDAFVIDLGLAGVFVERPVALPVGEKVRLLLPLPDSEIPLNAGCRVAWWNPEGALLASKSLPAGAGLEFLDMSEADGTRLREHLVEYCRQHPRVRRFLSHWPQGEKVGDDP